MPKRLFRLGVLPSYVLDTNTSAWPNARTVADRPVPIAEPGSPGELLDLIRRGEATTRGELVGTTGLARSTVAARIDQLIADRLIREVGDAPSTGGRPPALLAFNHEAGVVLAADLGATHARLAVTDLAARPLAELAEDIDIDDGPEAVLGWVEQQFDRLLGEAGKTPREVRGIGIGVPGPVEFSEGKAVHPPIMRGWHGYGIQDRLEARFDVPVLVDNDVNIMAVGEHWSLADPVQDLLFVKVGTGIGAGLILGGRIHRGDRGAAGDIGHIQTGAAAVRCVCGNDGCLEASAGGRALARQLGERGHATVDGRDVVRLVRAGSPDAVQAVRTAGRLIGSVLASIVNLLNPAVILIGGDVAESGQQLLAGIREAVYQRSTALSTNRLQISASALGDRAGITGAAAMVIEHLLAPEAVNAALRGDVGAKFAVGNKV